MRVPAMIATQVIVLISCALASCETPEQTALLGAMLTGNAIQETDPQRAAALASMGNSATGFANAQASRSQVTVIVPADARVVEVPGVPAAAISSSVPTPIRPSSAALAPFACNTVIWNHITKVLVRYEGKRDGEVPRFDTTEAITIVGEAPNDGKGEMSLGMYDSRGERVDAERVFLATDPAVIFCSVGAGRLSPGDYTAVWMNGNKVLGRITVRVTGGTGWGTRYKTAEQ